MFFYWKKTLEGREPFFDILNPSTPNEMSFFYGSKMDFFLWKKTLEGRVSIFDTLNPPTPNEMSFFYWVKDGFFFVEKPLKEGFQCLIP